MNFIDLLGYREITLKRDTEAAIIAFRNLAVEMCEAEVATEDAVKRDKPSKWAHRERNDARIRSHCWMPQFQRNQ